jgi:hypothetical protein
MGEEKLMISSCIVFRPSFGATIVFTGTPQVIIPCLSAPYIPRVMGMKNMAIMTITM